MTDSTEFNERQASSRSEAAESSEGREEDSSCRLHQATLEPEASIEGRESFQIAEAVEFVFVELMQGEMEDEIVQAPIPSPMYTGEEEGASSAASESLAESVIEEVCDTTSSASNQPDGIFDVVASIRSPSPSPEESMTEESPGSAVRIVDDAVGRNDKLSGNEDAVEVYEDTEPGSLTAVDQAIPFEGMTVIGGEQPGTVRLALEGQPQDSQREIGGDGVAVLDPASQADGTDEPLIEPAPSDEADAQIPGENDLSASTLEATLDGSDNDGLPVLGELPEEPMIKAPDDLQVPSGLEEEREIWEAPDIRVYIGADGKPVFVDEKGNPLNVQPTLIGTPKDESGLGKYTAIYPGQAQSDKFIVKEYIPDLKSAHVYIDPNGKAQIVDENGKLIPCPPAYITITNGKTEYIVNIPDKKPYHIPMYQPQTHNVQVYLGTPGKPILVDSRSGQPIDSPPHFTSGSDPEKIYILGPDGTKIEVQQYQPEYGGQVYTAPDGSMVLVDDQGIPRSYQPELWRDTVSQEVFMKGPNGEKIVIANYSPPFNAVYIHIAQDGTRTVVDDEGKPIACPPVYAFDPETGEFYTKDAEGAKVIFPTYRPETTDIYIYEKPGELPIVVDANGNKIDSPPHIHIDSTGSSGSKYYASYPGLGKFKIDFYKPPFLKT